MISGGGGSSAPAFAFGTAAARPAAATSANTGYYATDTGEVTFSDGTNWNQIKDTTTNFSFGANAAGVLRFGSNGAQLQGGVAPTQINLPQPLDITGAGNGLKVAEGTNAKQGTATLVGGTVTVSNTAVTATSRILLTIQSPGGTVGSVYVSARTAGTGFTITSTSAADTSVVAYEIFEVG